MKKIVFSILLLILSVAMGCAYKVPVLRMRSASMDVTGIRKIGILARASSSSQFEDGAQEFAAKVQEILKRKQFFSEVVLLKGSEKPTHELDAILNIQAQKMNVSVREGTERYEVMEETGRKIVETYIENGQQKTREVPEKVKKIYDVPTVQKRADIDLVIDLIPIKGSKSSKGIVLKDSSEMKGLGAEQIQAMPSDKVLLGAVANPLVSQLVNQLVPHIVVEKVKLASNSVCQPGVQMVKQGNWQGALESWQEVVTSNPENHAAHYNIGVAYEALKDYPAAMAAYQKAVSLSDRKQYHAAVTRLEQVIKENELLQQQMKGRSL